ncbi:MAG: nucleoside-diphosphate kinase [Candidatus Peribacteria bacterium]|jgi:nucleoside-diphosphate kinase|nr:nucleoside-diphosphate kinase [Candidatus Peribacteria bacterium]
MEEKKVLIQRSLVLAKPDAISRGLVGEILTRFEKVGLKIVGLKMVWPTAELLFEHYETVGQMITRRGQDKFDMTVKFMQQSPVIAFCFEGVEAVKEIRKMVGTTEPLSANPGTIRGDYAHMSFAYGDAASTGIPNLVHASGDPEEAKKEIALWFKDEELFDYPVANQPYMY